MIEMFLDILTRILQNQIALMYAELKHAEEEDARKLLIQGAKETCGLLGAIGLFRQGPEEQEQKKGEVIDMKKIL